MSEQSSQQPSSLAIATPNQYLPGDILQPNSNSTLSTHATKGRSVSGRSAWKLRPQKRASSLITKNRANARSTTWSAKAEAKSLHTEIKSIQQDMIQSRIEAKRLKHQNRLDNEKRKMENEYKQAMQNGKLQVLNVKKLGTTMKNMNKKQLRQIKKSRMNSKTGVVEFVGAYEK
jgi:rRNA-processing protein CGR1